MKKKKKIVIEEFSLQSIPVDAKDDITKTSPYKGVTRDILGSGNITGLYFIFKYLEKFINDAFSNNKLRDS